MAIFKAIAYHSTNKANDIIKNGIDINLPRNEDFWFYLTKVFYNKRHFEECLVFKKNCKVSKRVVFDDYTKIITLFECTLVSKKIELFNKYLLKYSIKIVDWDIFNILNLYELSIYRNDKTLINKVKKILYIRETNPCTNSKEKLIFTFFSLIEKKGLKSFEFYKQKLECMNSFDFRHCEWYVKGRYK